MNQSLYKKRYDPQLGSYVKKHIYGEGFTDILKKVGGARMAQLVSARPWCKRS